MRDRMTEVKYFQHSKNRTKKKINYLRIQRFKRLFHWFHFEPVRDLSHLLTVKKFLPHSAAEFLCERKSSIFWTRKSEWCLATARGFEDHKVCHINQQSTLSPLPPNRFFCHPDSGWSCDQPQPGSFFQRPREAEKRDPGNEVVNFLHTNKVPRLFITIQTV